MKKTSRLSSRVAASAILGSAAAGASRAEILYSGPVNQTLTYGSSTFRYDFDLDFDGTDDFDIVNNGSPTAKPFLGTLNTSLSTPLVRTNADSGEPITPGGVTVDGSFLAEANATGWLDSDGSSTVGDWGTGGTGYIGLQLGSDDDITYGWAQLTYDPDAGTLTLIDYAYETTPGLGIVTGAVPEPSTTALALIGGGAAGLAVLRARRRRA